MSQKQEQLQREALKNGKALSKNQEPGANFRLPESELRNSILGQLTPEDLHLLMSEFTARSYDVHQFEVFSPFLRP